MSFAEGMLHTTPCEEKARENKDGEDERQADGGCVVGGGECVGIGREELGYVGCGRGGQGDCVKVDEGGGDGA